MKIQSMTSLVPFYTAHQPFSGCQLFGCGEFKKFDFSNIYELQTYEIRRKIFKFLLFPYSSAVKPTADEVHRNITHKMYEKQKNNCHFLKLFFLVS